MLFLVACSCVTSINSSTIRYDGAYDGPKNILFDSPRWIINTPETEGISEASRIRITDQLMDRCEKYIGSEVLSTTAARNLGIFSSEVADNVPKMMASLSNDSYHYLMHVKIVGDEGNDGGVAYGGFERDNSATAELFVFSIPDGALLFQFFVRATEVTGSDDDSDYASENSDGGITIGKKNEKLQRNALDNALKMLKRQSNLPFKIPQES